MAFSRKLLLTTMATGALLPLLAFASGEIVATYLVGAVAIAVFVVVAALATSKPSERDDPNSDPAHKSHHFASYQGSYEMFGHTSNRSTTGRRERLGRG